MLFKFTFKRSKIGKKIYEFIGLWEEMEAKWPGALILYTPEIVEKD